MSKRRKPSGLAWADTIPDRWDTAKVCLVARLESGHTPSRQRPEYWVPEECTVPWFSLADVWQLREANQKYLGDTSEKISPLGVANSAARVLPAGTVVLSRTASVGFAGIMPRPMATTQDFANWICGTRLLPEYLLWAFRAMKPEFARMMMGSTHQTIYMPDIRRLAIPIPPLPEQRAIAEFLDRRTAAIDALIASKMRFVALIDEERYALVVDAVRGRLGSFGPRKDSGISWLGPVPASWEVRPLKRVAACLDGRRVPLNAVERSVMQGDVPYWGANGIVDRVDKHLFDEPLVLLGEDGAPFFEKPRPVAFFVTGKVWVNNHAHVLQTTGDMGPKFLVHFLNTVEFGAYIDGSTRDKLTQGKMREIPVPVPPARDQEVVLGSLEPRLAALDTLRRSVEQSVGVHREYRQALITAAVTGQLDIAATPQEAA